MGHESRGPKTSTVFGTHAVGNTEAAIDRYFYCRRVPDGRFLSVGEGRILQSGRRRETPPDNSAVNSPPEHCEKQNKNTLLVKAVRVPAVCPKTSTCLFLHSGLVHCSVTKDVMYEKIDGVRPD